MIQTRSAAIRAKLAHPIIDGDGHTIEFWPLLEEYVERVGGPRLRTGHAERFRQSHFSWYGFTPEQRRERRIARPPFWTLPSGNTLDLATVMFPKLLSDRMEAMGVDYTIIYPTFGLFMLRERDEEMRRVSCRALNIMNAELFGPYAARMTPAAAIPMHSPDEAITELEYAVKELGFKVAMIAGHVRRPIAEVARRSPDVSSLAIWVDCLGLDSAYDYDVFWAKCIELGVAPTAHSGGMGWGSRTSVTRYNYNHIGHFAAANEAFCKALFLGGVTRRFPSLRFGLLEGGVGWAASLYADLVAHWQKRNRKALSRLDPRNIDLAQFNDLARRYADRLLREKVEACGNDQQWLSPLDEDRATLDEWEACRIDRAQDIYDLFVPRFFFGCEANDITIPTAFNVKLNPFGARLRAMFSSDMGHWDVEDISESVDEAYHMVEAGHITEDDFCHFTFRHIVDLHATMNPTFFRGTSVEKAVQAHLAFPAGAQH